MYNVLESCSLKYAIWSVGAKELLNIKGGVIFKQIKKESKTHKIETKGVYQASSY